MIKKTLWICALLGFLLATGAYAQAPDVLNPPTKSDTKSAAKKKAKNAKRQASARAKFVSGSQETKKERSARLTRECKGEVNAGACTGYTR